MLKNLIIEETQELYRKKNIKFFNIHSVFIYKSYYRTISHVRHSIKIFYRVV